MKSKKTAIYLIVASLFILSGLFFVYLLAHNQPEFPKKIYNEKQLKIAIDDYQSYFIRNGTIGDFVAGVSGTLFGLAAFVLVYLTYIEQKIATEKERIEDRFFELIKLHKENINELKLFDPVTEELVASGRNVFKNIYRQIEASFYLIDIIFGNCKPSDILTGEIIKKLDNANLKNRDVLPIDFAKINIAYSIVFFGVGHESLGTVKDLLYREYKKNFIDAVFYFFSLVPHRSIKLGYIHWVKISKDKIFIEEILKALLLPEKNYKTILKNKFATHERIEDLKYLLDNRISQQKYFGGHQSKLGHYYRHIFQTVQFIDRQKIDYAEKYDYIKTFRAQFSNYEQHIFFFNSLSFMGRAWELDFKNVIYQPNLWLITKYNLIKNIPDLTLFNKIKVKEFYPDIDFEFENPPATRKKIIKYFK